MYSQRQNAINKLRHHTPRDQCSRLLVGDPGRLPHREERVSVSCMSRPNMTSSMRDVSGISSHFGTVGQWGCRVATWQRLATWRVTCTWRQWAYSWQSGWQWCTCDRWKLPASHSCSTRLWRRTWCSWCATVLPTEARKARLLVMRSPHRMLTCHNCQSVSLCPINTRTSNEYITYYQEFINYEFLILQIPDVL